MTVGGRTVCPREPAVSSLMFVRVPENYVLELSKRLKNTTPLMPYFDRDTRKPAAISDLEMNVFMLVTSTGDPGLEYLGEEPSDLRSGDRVRVTEGPFKGAEGYIKRIKGNRRLIVSIEGRRGRGDDLHSGVFPGENRLRQKIRFPRTACRRAGASEIH